jgi:hypothetical protein
MLGTAGRWWPIPVAVGLSLLIQRAAYTGRYEVRGHAAGHLSSGSFVFLAVVVAGVLLWSTPAARRSPLVLVGLAVWLSAGVAIAIGNVLVVDALIDTGQATTSTGGITESSTLSDSHWLANAAPFVAVVGAFVVVFALYLVGAASARLAGVAGVLNVLVPPWILPGSGVILITIACVVLAERTARSTVGRPEVSREIGTAL